MILTLLLGLRLLNSSKIFVNKLPNKNIKKYNEKTICFIIYGNQTLQKTGTWILEKIQRLYLEKNWTIFFYCIVTVILGPY